MTTTTDVRSSILDAISRDLHVSNRDDSQLVRLPLALADGHIIEVLARHLEGEVWYLSDRGQAAESLWDAGVDLTRGAPSRSWEALIRALNLPPAPIHEGDAYVVSMGSTTDKLGSDVLRLGEAVLFADSLRVLGRPSPKPRLRERIIRVASEMANVTVLPKARARTHHGGSREVTAKITSADDRLSIYAQGVGGGGSTAYDHARSLFADLSIDRGHMAAVIGRSATIEPWQRAALAEVATVVDEEEMADAFADLLRAA